MLNFNIDQGARSMKDSVSAVFVSKSKVYFIKRQNYLPTFPGHHASPGGKVDHSDYREEMSGPLWPKDISPKILHALVREMQEELNYDIHAGIATGEIIAIDYLGVSVTPDFNPYRFNNYYLKITMAHEVEFLLDENEAIYGAWKSPQEFLVDFYQGKMLAVPPAITLLECLARNISHAEPINFIPNYDPDLQVPMFESLFGIKQLMPLSNTFPPANRTNAFIIGDDNQKKILIDPSPKDEVELKKLLYTIGQIKIDSILLTHHHPDHYQFSREIALHYKIGIELSQYTFNQIGSAYFKDINIMFRKEGDIVTKSLGEDIIVYEVPGHDEGQLALAPRNLSWFLVGDLIQTIGTVVIAAPEGNMRKYFGTLERVIALDPQYIIPSHGIILGGTHKLTETLKHRKAREAQIIELLNHNKSEEEILHTLYKELNPLLLPYAKKTIAAHLLKLKGE
jgi:glyoxylase-like metal-dependent hydrolase (beta-lactamase superfamily II)/8-oxo-dGTP pyrophosphatase MutT (NUDIX family)